MSMVISWFDDVRNIWRQIGNTTTREPTFYPTTPDHPDGSVDLGPLPVILSDNASKLFDFFFMDGLGPPTTVLIQPAIGDYTLTVADGATFIIGERVGIFDVDGRYYLGVVLSKAVNVLTLDTPIDFEFPIGDTVIALTSNMNVDASGGDRIFSVNAGTPPNSKLHLDITQIVFAITCGSYPEHDQFGDITGLIEGISFQTEAYHDGEVRNIFNIKTNTGLAVLDDYQIYPERTGIGPPSDYLLIAKIHFSGVDKHGSVVRLAPGDQLRAILREDFTGLDSFQIMAKGHLADEHIYHT